ncbi:NAD-dependent epimerase/dehydratase family protein [Paenibacillus sp. LMG 31456]|uniref:NAD-dependent epimerase/dehydratase family protein n=1 Tax=Paenibacillus foliorum TaxID=2654974 RepID=A0A972GLJ0_9BACL|nr:GDP-mannose 4,6-dehydratase [Paenibacillus foliorum]NOU92959.1 NAD-dependent epimerase/dehydratase family protein [Paenibacillus foliorum]
MKAFITGISGFVGSYLCEKLLQEGYQVSGISRRVELKKNKISFHSCEINDKQTLKQILEKYKPDEIYHLAGPAFIPFSYNNPFLVYDILVNGTLTLYEAVRELGLDCKILYVGSADVYGNGEGNGFEEERVLHPNNPYAGGKACADLISEQYAKTYGLQIMRARPFNHTGPEQNDSFVCSNFAKQIASMEIEGKNEINVGNINVSRDFLDVRDVVNAYHLIMQKGTQGEVYNVCSGKATKISEILDWLFYYSNINDSKINVDPAKLRSIDAPIRFGNNQKLLTTGWIPKYDLKDTMRDMLYYWRGVNDEINK